MLSPQDVPADTVTPGSRSIVSGAVPAENPTLRVALWPWLQHGDVRLGLPMRSYRQRALHAGAHGGTGGAVQQANEFIHTARVPRPDRRHLDDLAVEQLDAVVLAEGELRSKG